MRAYLFDGMKAIPFHPHMTLEEFIGHRPETGAALLTVEQAYRFIAPFRAAVNRRAGGVASCPWRVVDDEGNTVYDSMSGLPLPADLGFLADMSRFLAQVERMLSLYGVAYYLIVRERGKLTLRFLHPASIREVYESGRIVRYDRYDSTGYRHLSPDSVLRIALPPIMDEVSHGPPPAEAALIPATEIYHMDRFAATYFRRGAVKQTLFIVPGNPPEEEMRRLKSWWRDFLNGIRSAWERAFLSRRVEPVVIGEGLEALERGRQVEMLEREIAMAFEVPFSMIASNAANYATSRQDVITFWQNVLVPELRLIEDALNGSVIAPGYRLILETGRMEAAQEMQLAQAGMVYELTGLPILEIDEARQLIGLPPLHREGSPEEVADELEEALAEVRAYARARMKRRLMWEWEWAPPEMEAMLTPLAGNPKLLAEAVRHITSAMKAPELDDVEEEIYRAVLRVLRKYAPTIREALLEGRVPDLRSLEHDLRRALSGTFLYAVIAEADEYSSSIAQALATDDVAELTEWAVYYAAERAQQMRESTERAIRKAVARGPVSNPSPLVARLAGQPRALLVAMTERTRMHTTAITRTRDYLREQGVSASLTWVTAHDEKVCPICEPLDGKPESVWSRRVQDGPPAHPRCRCRLRLEVKR